MADTIDIAGKPVKKSLLAGMALAVIVLGGAIYVRNKKANAAATASPIIDPATGFQQGSPEDLAALSQLQASYQGTGLGGGSGGGGSISSPPGTGGFTSNAEWAQAAEDYIVNTAQGNATVVGNALGKYLTGSSVTPDQINIINQAIAFEGYPPVPGPNGFPPAIREAPAPPPPKPPPPATTVIVPDVRGMGYGHAFNVCKAAGLKVTNTGRINSTWEVTKQSLTPGSKVKKDTGIFLTVIKHPAVR